MSSWDEDKLFADWGWEKDLINRVYRGPFNHELGFDAVMQLTSTPDGEAQLKAFVRRYGKKVLH